MRPWNAQLKVLCWKAGESFVKVSGNENALYGRLYAERKELETQRNAEGAFAQTAQERAGTVGKATEAYKHYSDGRLPPGHIHARAKRYAVKMFLSHLHEVWRKAEGLEVPKPFALAMQGHAHYIPPEFVDDV